MGPGLGLGPSICAPKYFLGPDLSLGESDPELNYEGWKFLNLALQVLIFFGPFRPKFFSRPSGKKSKGFGPSLGSQFMPQILEKKNRDYKYVNQ